MATVLLCSIACLVLASTCNGSKNYISHCRYVGHQCSTGDVNSTGLRGFLTGNVSCGNSSSSATEYCTLANPNEEDLDRFQCFSLYEFNKVTKRRVLVVAGCIFNHPLSICTANTCNFSHEVDLDADHGRPNSTLHYCCCNTKNDCNRNGIVGYPSSTPTTSTAVATGMTPRTGAPFPPAQDGDPKLNTGSIIGIVVGSAVVLAVFCAAFVVRYRCRHQGTLIAAWRNSRQSDTVIDNKVLTDLDT